MISIPPKQFPEFTVKTLPKLIVTLFMVRLVKNDGVRDEKGGV